MLSIISSAVNKFIRNKATKKFLTKKGGWTRYVWEAWDIQQRVEATEIMRRFNLTEVEIYYSFQQENASQWDFTLPLPSNPVGATLPIPEATRVDAGQRL